MELFESGKSVAEIARDLDVNPLSIYEWKRQAERTSGLSPQRVPTGVLLFLLAVGILLVAVPVLFRLLIITAETVVDGGVK